MLVLNLMNSNENWREVLSNAPYNIIIKEEDGYILLKYNQLDSDFAILLCASAVVLFSDRKMVNGFVSAAHLINSGTLVRITCLLLNGKARECWRRLMAL